MNRYKIYKLFIILFLSVIHVLNGQEKDIKFERISLEQGLSQSSIYSMCQDKEGMIWFGTLDGLNKFDGYKFTKYRHNRNDPTSISDNSINCVFEDSKGILWIGTRTMGISKYDKIKNYFVNIKSNPKDPASLCDNDVRAIIEDKDGLLWIATANGLCSYDKIGNVFKSYKVNPFDTNSIPSNNVYVLACDKFNNLWIGTDKGLSKRMPFGKVLNFKHIDNISSTLSHNLVKSILIDAKENIWVGTDHGLNKFSINGDLLNTYLPIPNKNSISSFKINDILEDHNGILWIASQDNGLIRFDPLTNIFSTYKNDPSNPNSLLVNTILSLFQDKTKILWVGTYLGGIHKWNRAAEELDVFRHNPYDAQSLSSSKVRTIYQDKKGVIWVGTTDGGLNKWKTTDDRFEHYKHDIQNPYSISNNHVRSIFEDKIGNFWVGTDGGGMNLLDRNSKKFQRLLSQDGVPGSISSNSIWNIFQDSKGRLWIATTKGLNQYDYQTKKFRQWKHSDKDPKSLSHDQVTMIMEDSNHTLWVGTMGGGLNIFDPEKNEFKAFKHDPKNDKSIGDDRIYSIVEDSEKTLWIGTKGTLNRLNRNDFTFQTFDERDGFPNDVFMGIVEDKQGNLWISTNCGLSRFNKKNFKIRNYDVKDGLQSNEFLVGSYCKSSNGELFFGGIDGFNAFFPERIVENPNPPQILITGFKINNKDMILDTAIFMKKEIKLKWNQNILSFDFVALDYVFPQKNQYAYKMEGFDKDWIEFGTGRFTTYTNMPHGVFTFRVKGSNNDGVWNNQGASIRIIISPPFWKTKIFYIFIFLVIIALIFLYVKWRERKLQNDKRILENLVQERTKEIVEASNEIREQAKIIEQKSVLIEQKSKDITDSIEYASRIQSALLPPVEMLESNFVDHFVLYKPRDIVSGDFYWFDKIEERIIFVAADCTGHGVPGAFMSMLGISFLNEIVHKNPEITAAEILNELRDYVKNSLRQTGKDGESKDGMDISLCVIEKDKTKLYFAGAFNPLFVIRNGELVQVDADKMPIGIYYEQEVPFRNSEWNLQAGDVLYMFSDGYMDQFGGTKGKKFYLKKFKELLVEIHTKPMKEQKEFMDKTIETWRGHLEQVDDILVVGFRLE